VWSRGAAQGNQENLILSRCPRLASRFAAEFERLWLALDPTPPPAPAPPPAAAAPPPAAADGAGAGAEVLFFQK